MRTFWTVCLYYSLGMGFLQARQIQNISLEHYPLIKIGLTSQQKLNANDIRVFDDQEKVEGVRLELEREEANLFHYSISFESQLARHSEKHSLTIYLPGGGLLTGEIDTRQSDKTSIPVVGTLVFITAVGAFLVLMLRKQKRNSPKVEPVVIEPEPIAPTGFSFGYATHIGLVREENEDSCGRFVTPNGDLFLVCDGIGGHAGGATASMLALETIRDFVNQGFQEDPKELLKRAMMAANQAIITDAVQNPHFKGMGTTCVAVLIQGLEIFFGHVGDSRIYLFSQGRLQALTKDHSFVQSLVDQGQLSVEQASHHPRRNQITKALGMVQLDQPTIAEKPISARLGDCLLLCSDGLTSMISDARIERILKKQSHVQEKTESLIELANLSGGTDNITVQLICFNQQ